MRPSFSPGMPSDNFHLQPVGTHAAAVDRLRATGGYQFFGASEGGPVLCPSWATSNTWNQGTHVNCAIWMLRQEAQSHGRQLWSVVRVEQMALLAQQMMASLMSGWLYCSKGPCSPRGGRKQSSGSVSGWRASCSLFAAAGEPGPPSLSGFGVDVVIPMVKRFFRALLKQLGPRAPLPSNSALLRWKGAEDTRQAVYQYRLRCHACTKTCARDETFAACLNKAAYWLSSTSFLNAVLKQLWPSVVNPAVQPQVRLEPRVEEDSVNKACNGLLYISVPLRRVHLGGRHAAASLAEEEACDTCRIVAMGPRRCSPSASFMRCENHSKHRSAIRPHVPGSPYHRCEQQRAQGG